MADVLTRDDLTHLLTASPTPVAFFVYGTLRPGQGNARLWTVESHVKGSVYGYGLYGRPGHASYPWMVDTQYTEVKGDLVWVKPDARMHSIVRMEENAGYTARIVRVYTETMDEPIPAIAFVYPHVPLGTEQIMSGDWTIPN